MRLGSDTNPGNDFRARTSRRARLSGARENQTGARNNPVRRAATAVVESVERRVLFAAGDLDPTFGTGTGRVVTDFGGPGGAALAVAHQPDGKLLAAGGVNGGVGVARYLADGSPDPAFGDLIPGAGGARTGRTVVPGADTAGDMAVLPNGQIVVAGSGFNPNRPNPDRDAAVLRLNADGSPASVAYRNFQEEDFANAVGVLPGGRVVVAGSSTPDDQGALRGFVFGDSFMSRTTFHATALAVQLDGRVVVGGNRTIPLGPNPDSPTTVGMALVRLNADGSLDDGTTDLPDVDATPGDSFDVAAPAPPLPGDRPEWLNDLFISGDRTLVLAGSVVADDVGRTDSLIYHLGNPDFGDAGRLKLTLSPESDAVVALARRTDGSDKFYAAAVARNPVTGLDEPVILRLNPDGTPDTTFNGDGRLDPDFGPGAGDGLRDGINDIVLTPAGLVAAGHVSDAASLDFLTARFLDDPVLGGGEFGAIRGLTFEDMDHKGSYAELLDRPLPGVTVYVDYDDNDQPDAGEPTTVSGPDGIYTFTDIPVGVHTVRQIPIDDPEVVPTLSEGEAVVYEGVNEGPPLGHFRFGSIRGLVFDDFNGNQRRDPGDLSEVPMAGWEVYLDLNANRQLDPGEPARVTGADGTYRFDHIDAGSYLVRVERRPGWYTAVDQFQAVVRSSTDAVVGDFAMTSNAVVTGRVFDDDVFGAGFRNGVFDEGEGIGGVTVYADFNENGTLDSGEQQTTTITFPYEGYPVGTYFLGRLSDRAYRIRVVSPPNYGLLVPAAGLHSVVATRGQAVGNFDFGHGRLATVTGNVFNDLDADGSPRQPQDPGLPVATRVFADLDADQAFDAGEPFTFSDPSTGDYALPLDAGTYTLRAELPPGWVPSFPASRSYTVTLAKLETVTGRDFGGFTFGSVSGVLFDDRDADGVQDTGESLLEGRTVYIDLDRDGNPDAGEVSTATAADGSYSIGGLLPGTYQVRQVLPDGWLQTFPGAALPHVVGVLSNTDAGGRNFGSRQPRATISGLVFSDLDGDGVRDAGEPTLADRTVYLDADNDAALDAGERSVVTNGSGGYLFDNLTADTYFVRLVVPAGSVQTAPAAGEPHVVAASGSQTYGGRDFALAAEPAPQSLSAAADATVASGSPTANFGQDAALAVGQLPTPNENRAETYLRFDLNGVTNITKGTLRLFGALAADHPGGVNIAVFGSGNVTWPEDGITWNTKPAAGIFQQASKVVAGTTPQWHEFDVGNYLRSQRQAGARFVTLVLRSTTAGAPPASFASDEAADPSTRPQLLLNDFEPPQTNPTVTGVFARGTAWAGSFLSYVHSAGLGHFQYGFGAGPSADAPGVLPWANLNRITLRFNEDVIVGQNDLSVRGVRVPQYAVQGFSYDPVLFTATWTLTRPVGADRLLLALSPAVTDRMQNPLAGPFTQRLDVLPGDVNRDGQVVPMDALRVRLKFNSATNVPRLGAAAYDPLHDLDGSGRIIAGDLSIATRNLMSRLPAGSPTAAASRSLFSAMRVRASGGGAQDPLAALLA